MAAAATPSVNDLKRHQSALINAHWSNIVEHLSPPGVAWEWSESSVTHRVKYRWKESGLIYRSPSGDRWMTSRRLWAHVVETAGSDESVGAEATGEHLLMDVPTFEAQSKSDEDDGSRVYSDPDPSAWKRSLVEQATLTGGVADADDIDNDRDRVMENQAKGRSAQDRREKAAEAAGQMKIGAFTPLRVPRIG
ncbi:hypothetical protein [Halorubrum amylolyticum]|uniref:hypothetical protein n=1 Tax=Halorubrum amylolyticum TaxID=2508724 RepID=UPI001008C69F|nr:hypothetical protein [Halorubrum amylolyticum]